MDLMLVPDGHYYKAADGHIYVESVYNYNFFKRYLQVFNRVFVVGRVTKVEKISPTMKLASGMNVEFLELPAYRGPWQYLKNYRKINSLAREYSEKFDCAIFRVPGATANIMCRKFAAMKKPFALEVVVDPWESLQKGTVKSIFRPLVRLTWTNFLKKICKRANGVSYVTKEFLQRKYPSYSICYGESERFFDTSYSSVSIKADTFGKPKKYLDKEKFVISHVDNSFASYRKGHITLMKTLKLVREENFNVDLLFVGDGPLKSEFIKISEQLGIRENVNFIGRLSDGDSVRKVISKSDIFILPTMAEGLPRVVLEAMSVGLPCLSSPVSGIPEILPKEYLVDYRDSEGYANKLIELFKNKNLLERASIQNIKTAEDYTEEKLNEKRKAFYERLLQIAEPSSNK
jgi:glycosyltransferase involved in cell wall biosynthesis